MTERTVTHASFVIERHYDSPREAVFNAFADPDKKRRWFAEGEGFALDEYELDFRVGGRERSRFRFVGNNDAVAEGTPMGNDTTFMDIIDQQRIVFAYSMSMGGKPFSASLATIELLAVENGTALVFTEQGAFFEGGDNAEMRERGWRELFDALQKALST
ncbi:MAG: SRPBCC family protein [Proteobacteria bacterium]|nr:SRPBCC family protein [Pseudomonadota bacterium]